MSHLVLDVAAVATPAGAALLSEADRADLLRFLETVANSALKVRILRLFLSDPGLCLSSPALSDRLGESIFETRRTVQQLDAAGALNYCPHFAFTDLCHLSMNRLAAPMRADLTLLLSALRFQPELVWRHFDEQATA